MLSTRILNWPLPAAWGSPGPMKQIIEVNLTGQESQVAGGRPVGYVQAQPRSWTGSYLEQIQLVVRVWLELVISRFQTRHPKHSTTLPPQTSERAFWVTSTFSPLIFGCDLCGEQVLFSQDSSQIKFIMNSNLLLDIEISCLLFKCLSWYFLVSRKVFFFDQGQRD